MKKFVVMVTVSAFVLMVMGSTLSYAASSIGFIDVQKVFKEYKATVNAQEQVSKQEEEFKKEFDDSQKKLADAEKKNMKKEDIEKLRKELEDKLSPKRQNLITLNEKLTATLQAEILNATKDVAKQVGIDVVLDKQVVITGGVDLTEMVVTKLNK